MKVEYNEEVDAAYIELQNETPEGSVEAEHFSPLNLIPELIQ